MEEEDYVDGDGIISDDSDFYGSEQTKDKLEAQARRPTKRYAISNAPPPRKKVKLDKDLPKTKAAQTPSNVLDFLKSRPQLARTQQPSPAVKQSQSFASQYEEIATNAETSSDHNSTPRQASRQQNETVLAFLRRLPVSDPATASIGPWLWIHNPSCPTHWNQPTKTFSTDLSTFTSIAQTMLSDFDDRKDRIKDENPGKAPGALTRKTTPYRDALEKDLLATAKRLNITSGKWMLFPSSEELARSWRIVAEATAAGKLGPTSKVGTWEAGNEKKGTLICVYTHDFADHEDVKRVLLQLLGLELLRPGGRQVYYKCDAYTYLGLGSGNEYNLKASLYASGKVLEDVPAVREGGSAGLKKIGTVDGFVTQGKWEF